MQGYLDIVRNVVNNGKWKKPVRRGTDGSEIVLPHDTLALPNQVFSHNMADGFPLLTTKKMPLRVILVELEGFIKGITSKKWYKDRNCNIWNEWANPKVVQEEYNSIPVEQKKECGFPEKEYKLHLQKETDDLGPIYGYQWRNFGTQYGEVTSRDFIEGGCCPATGEYQQIYDNVNGLGYFDVKGGTDQLKEIVDRLHENPYDRRMVCSAWNPNQIDQMALPPCHYAWNVTVIGDEINLAWVQRSVDTGLGLCFNIASYATLLLLLAKESGFKPGNLTGLLVDCHIYSNHIDKLKEQLEREPYKLPTLDILSKDDGKFSIFNWEHTDYILSGYESHSKIDFGEVTV